MVRQYGLLTTTLLAAMLVGAPVAQASDVLWTTDAQDAREQTVNNNAYTVSWHPVLMAQQVLDIANGEVRDEIIREANIQVNGHAAAQWVDDAQLVNGTAYDGYLTFKHDRSASNNAMAQIWVSFNNFYYVQFSLRIVDAASGAAVDSNAWSSYSMGINLQVVADRPADSYEEDGQDNGIVTLPATPHHPELGVEVPDTGVADANDQTSDGTQVADTGAADANNQTSDGTQAADTGEADANDQASDGTQVADTGAADANNQTSDGTQVADTGAADANNQTSDGTQVVDTGEADANNQTSDGTQVADTGAADANDVAAGETETPDTGAIGANDVANGQVEVPDTGYADASGAADGATQVPDTGYADGKDMTGDGQQVADPGLADANDLTPGRVEVPDTGAADAHQVTDATEQVPDVGFIGAGPEFEDSAQVPDTGFIGAPGKSGGDNVVENANRENAAGANRGNTHVVATSAVQVANSQGNGVVTVLADTPKMGARIADGKAPVHEMLGQDQRFVAQSNWLFPWIVASLGLILGLLAAVLFPIRAKKID